MELSPEDALRLNVMLVNQPQAIRIDESRMIVHALSEKGEAQIKLNPTGRDDQYIKRVRELISGHIMGSPGGYPVYIQRWTRMGQMRDESLEQLLLLGEPEAVVAAVHAAGLTDELARRAWWAMEDAENARQMLSKPSVVEGQVGPVLARYLIDYLPFETEAENMISTIRLVLQPGLVDEETRLDLWKKARRKNAYLVGFLSTTPDDLPGDKADHPDLQQYQQKLEPFVSTGHPLASLLVRILSASGQQWLDTLLQVLQKPVNQDVVNSVLDIVADYFSAARPEGVADATLDELLNEADDWVRADVCRDLLVEAADCRAIEDRLRAVRVLSGLSYGVVRPVFRESTAIGSLMRRKLEPVITPLKVEIDRLLAKN